MWYLRQILARPDAETLASVEIRWRQAVSDKSLSKLNRTVIKRVFAAVSPQTATSILKDSDCQRLLGVLKRQFELTPAASSKADWLGLNANIVECMRDAGLDLQRPIENNIAMWSLVEQSFQPALVTPAVVTAEEPTVAYASLDLSVLTATSVLV